MGLDTNHKPFGHLGFDGDVYIITSCEMLCCRKEEQGVSVSSRNFSFQGLKLSPDRNKMVAGGRQEVQVVKFKIVKHTTTSNSSRQM